MGEAGRNIHRRHLTPGQRAALALELLPPIEAEARARQGSRTDLVVNSHGSDSLGRSDAIAAELVGAGQQTVSRLKRVAREAPDLLEEVKRGERTVNSAYAETQERESGKAIEQAANSLTT
jgi:hypothetical protein